MATVNVEFSKGNVIIENDVIAQICGIITTECYGVVGIANASTTKGIASLLMKDKYSKGVNIYISEDKALSADIHIIIEYGVNIQTISDSIIKNVKYQLNNITGLEVDNVKVFVDGTRVRE